MLGLLSEAFRQMLHCISWQKAFSIDQQPVLCELLCQGLVATSTVVPQPELEQAGHKVEGCCHFMCGQCVIFGAKQGEPRCISAKLRQHDLGLSTLAADYCQHYCLARPA